MIVASLKEKLTVGKQLRIKHKPACNFAVQVLGYDSTHPPALEKSL